MEWAAWPLPYTARMQEDLAAGMAGAVLEARTVEMARAALTVKAVETARAVRVMKRAVPAGAVESVRP